VWLPLAVATLVWPVVAGLVGTAARAAGASPAATALRFAGLLLALALPAGGVFILLRGQAGLSRS